MSMMPTAPASGLQLWPAWLCGLDWRCARGNQGQICCWSCWQQRRPLAS
jgi:hypothetical protein